jgi:hypothetical protein
LVNGPRCNATAQVGAERKAVNLERGRQARKSRSWSDAGDTTGAVKGRGRRGDESCSTAFEGKPEGGEAHEGSEQGAV